MAFCTQTRRVAGTSVAVALAICLLGPGSAAAARGDCSQPLSNGTTPLATDCLFILQAAVFLQTCNPECTCAPKGSLPVTATDALICLRAATGLSVPLQCPCQVVTTTSSSTSTQSTTTSSMSTTTSSLQGFSTFPGDADVASSLGPPAMCCERADPFGCAAVPTAAAGKNATFDSAKVVR